MRSIGSFMDRKLTSRFKAILTLVIDMDAEEAMAHYALRAEQKNDLEQWRGQLKYLWKNSGELRTSFSSSTSILDEMHKIRIVEYADKQKVLVVPHS